jgi:peptidoglycan/xylan/chitin deacetylase (PgdA/CDA1 family)
VTGARGRLEFARSRGSVQEMGPTNVSTAAKCSIKKALVHSHALRWARRFAPACVAILMYHSVLEEPELYADLMGRETSHSAAVFRQQMEVIARHFTPIALADVLLFLRGERTLPARAVMVTFDDGYRDNVQVAAPVLNGLGIPAVIYLTAGLMGTCEVPWYCRVRRAFTATRANFWREPVRGDSWGLQSSADRARAAQVVWNRCSAQSSGERCDTVRNLEEDLGVQPPTLSEPLMMSWSEARSLHRMGHQLGSHSLTHPNLAHVSEAEARWELMESKRVLESNLGISVEHFSYPHPALNPNWNVRTLRLSQEAGYQTAVTTVSRVVRAGANPLALCRIRPGRSLSEFLWNVDYSFLGRAV